MTFLCAKFAVVVVVVVIEPIEQNVSSSIGATFFGWHLDLKCAFLNDASKTKQKATTQPQSFGNVKANVTRFHSGLFAVCSLQWKWKSLVKAYQHNR